MNFPTCSDREAIDDTRRKRIEVLAPFTLFRCGWLTPSGHVQGQIYYRTSGGLGPTSRDRDTHDVLRDAVSGGYDKPWGIEVLSTPVMDPRPVEVIVECPGCSTDGSNAMGLRGHLSDCVYNPMRVAT